MPLNATFSKLDQLTDFFVSEDPRVNAAVLLIFGAFAIIAYWYLRFLTSRLS